MFSIVATPGYRHTVRSGKNQGQPQSLDQPQAGREFGSHIMAGKFHQWTRPGVYPPLRHDHQMPVPPRRQRQKIIRASCSDLLSERDIERISAVDALAPAVVTRASAVVKVIGDELAQTEQAPGLELIINNTLEAQGHKRIKRHDPNQLPETMTRHSFTRTPMSKALSQGLKKTKAGRLCLYGPSGTGKTAYGRWLAEQLETPLLVKRGSDLISMWVGGTEKEYRRVFPPGGNGGGHIADR